MVELLVAARGIDDPRVLAAMREVPRHRFVPDAVAGKAYGDHSLPIGFGQTISQPYVVGRMTQLLKVEPHHRVLEVGCGSGYQAAVLGRLARMVFTLERVSDLARRERQERQSAKGEGGPKVRTAQRARMSVKSM
jgi:protein-L-isoaspartate(D-aspartate) O-methyltransferase